MSSKKTAEKRHFSQRTHMRTGTRSSEEDNPPRQCNESEDKQLWLFTPVITYIYPKKQKKENHAKSPKAKVSPYFHKLSVSLSEPDHLALSAIAEKKGQTRTQCLLEEIGKVLAGHQRGSPPSHRYCRTNRDKKQTRNFLIPVEDYQALSWWSREFKLSIASIVRAIILDLVEVEKDG